MAALWPEGDFAVADYIEKVCRTSLDYWLTAGPDAGLLSTGEVGADAMQYLIGFLLWTQAAYGPDTLRGVLQSAACKDVASSQRQPAPPLPTYVPSEQPADR